MRTKKKNEEYFKEERIKREKTLKLYEEQDKALVDKMISDYKWFHAYSTAFVVSVVIAISIVIYSNLADNPYLP